MLSFRRGADEEGVVLITVLLVTFVLLILVAGTMAYAIGSQPLSRRDQDWNAALERRRGGTGRLPLPPEPERPVLPVRRGADHARLRDRAHARGAARREPGVLAVVARARRHQQRDVHLPRRHVVPVTGRGHRLVDREGRQRHPDGAGDPPPPRVHRLPVLHRLRDEGPGRVHQRPTTTRPPRRRPTARCTTTRAGTSTAGRTSRGTPTGTPARTSTSSRAT